MKLAKEQELERQSRRKKKPVKQRTSKSGKRRKDARAVVEDDHDDDIPVMHVVSTTIDAPEVFPCIISLLSEVHVLVTKLLLRLICKFSLYFLNDVLVYFTVVYFLSVCIVCTVCVVLIWWLSSCRRRSWAMSMLHREPDVSLPGPTAPSVTELLQLLVPGYGTVYRHISEMPTYHTVGSIFVWIVGPRHGTVRTILTAPSRNNLTYSLTCCAALA